MKCACCGFKEDEKTVKKNKRLSLYRFGGALTLLSLAFICLDFTNSFQILFLMFGLMFNPLFLALVATVGFFVSMGFLGLLYLLKPEVADRLFGEEAKKY